jgi:hypothetical protein
MQLNDGDRDWFCAHIVDTNVCIIIWKGNLDIAVDCLFNDNVSGSYNIASINIVGNDGFFANDVFGNVGSVM